MEEELEKIVELVRGADFVNFSPFGEGVPEELIKRAETYLGFKLPESYKWWVRSYGGGEISSEEIYSIYNNGLDDSFAGGDICHMHKLNKERGWDNHGERLFISQPPGTDECFYFKKSIENEWPVYRADAGLRTENLYAKSFAEFLIKRINEWLD